MKYYPRIKEDVLLDIEQSLVKCLLSEGQCTTCDECLFCTKNLLHLTGGDWEEQKAQLLIPINATCSPEMNFFEVRCGGDTEYHTTLESAQERAKELLEFGLNATITGKYFVG